MTLEENLIFAAKILGGTIATIAALGGTTLSYLLYTKKGRLFARKHLLNWMEAAPNPLPNDVPFPKRVLPHAPIEKLADGFWIVRGTLPNFPAGFERVMAIYRPPGSNELLLFSSLCVDEDTLRQIDELGKVSIIYVPCHWHTLDATAYKRRYPNAKVVGPRKAMSRVEGKTEIEEASEEMFPFFDEAKSIVVPSNPMEASIMLVRPHGVSEEFNEFSLLVKLPNNKRGLIVNDLLFNKPPPPPTTFQKLMGKKEGNRSGVSIIGRVLMIDDYRVWSHWLRDVFFEKLVRGEKVDAISFSHGMPIVGHDFVMEYMQGTLKAVV